MWASITKKEIEQIYVIKKSVTIDYKKYINKYKIILLIEDRWG